MAVTVTPGVAVQATTGTSLTATIPASADGDVTLLCVNSAAASGTQVLNVPAGWTPVFGTGGVHQGGRPGGVANVFWRKWLPGDPTTQAVTQTISGFLIVAPLLVRGTAPDAPFEAADYFTNVNVLSGGDIPAPSLNATKSQFLLVYYSGYHAINAARSWTPPPGMTEILDYAPSNATAANSVSVDTKVLTATGATGTQNAKCNQGVYPVGFSMLIAPPPATGTVLRMKGGVPVTVRYLGQPIDLPPAKPDVTLYPATVTVNTGWTNYANTTGAPNDTVATTTFSGSYIRLNVALGPVQAALPADAVLSKVYLGARFQGSSAATTMDARLVTNAGGQQPLRSFTPTTPGTLETREWLLDPSEYSLADLRQSGFQLEASRTGSGTAAIDAMWLRFVLG